MPGGLARVAGEVDSRVIAMQRGGRSKDTWVLSDTPVNASFSLLTSTVKAADLVSPSANLPSRAAENLFWFGRYGERCDNTARLLRVAIDGVLDERSEQADAIAPPVLLAQQLGLIEADEQIGLQLLRAATHPKEGLSQQLRQLSRCAFSLRDRMSLDNWRSLNQLVADPVFQRGLSSSVGLPLALVWLDRAVTSMMTLSGFVLDGMTRGLGWRFLSIGRRVERLGALCNGLAGRDRQGALAAAGLAAGAERFVGDLPLALPGRARVAAGARPAAARRGQSALDRLPAEGTVRVRRQARDPPRQLRRATIWRLARAALRSLDVAELDPESEALAALLEQIARAARTVSDELSHKFFSHAVSRSVLSLAA